MPRIEIEKFAQAMEYKLKKNDYKGGWDKSKIEFLFDKLLEEVYELHHAIMTGDCNEKILTESADVANMAMMIADKYMKLYAPSIIDLKYVTRNIIKQCKDASCCFECEKLYVKNNEFKCQSIGFVTITNPTNKNCEIYD